MVKITFIIPYPEIRQKVLKYISEAEKTDDIIIETTHLVGTRHEFLNNKNLDIVIARGLTFKALASKPNNIAAVEIPVTGYDVLRAIDYCKKNFKAKKIAIIYSELNIYEIPFLEKIMDTKLYVFNNVNNEADSEEAIVKCLREGVDAIVSGLTTRTLAETKYGFRNCEFIRTGDESIRNAIKEAINAAKIKKIERANAELFKITLESIKEGIFSVDESLRVTTINSAARKILNIPHDKDVLGEDVKNIVPHANLRDILDSGREELFDVKTIEGATVVENRIPITVSGKTVGAVCTFEPIDKVQEKETQIRKKISARALNAKYTFSDILGESQIIKNTIKISYKYSQVNSNILIIGETGTGKELFAQSIHNASKRRLNPFVAINCAAVPENLLESELFGYAEGAFSGAAKGGKIGLFEIAHTGTLFLDEIAELPVSLQAKLLRVLQEKEIRRIGDSRIIPVDVRIISATNKDLNEKVLNKEFRQDLFYRLNVLELTIPPLRARNVDIVIIAEYFIKMYGTRYQKEHILLAKDAKEFLFDYNWPGNIRELGNLCERLVVLTENEVITKDEISELFHIYDKKKNDPEKEAADFGANNDELLRLLNKAKIKKADLAEFLGVSRTTLWRRQK